MLRALLIFSTSVNVRKLFLKMIVQKMREFLVFLFLNCTDLFHFHEYLDLVSEAT